MFNMGNGKWLNIFWLLLFAQSGKSYSKYKLLDVALVELSKGAV